MGAVFGEGVVATLNAKLEFLSSSTLLKYSLKSHTKNENYTQFIFFLTDMLMIVFTIAVIGFKIIHNPSSIEIPKCSKSLTEDKKCLLICHSDFVVVEATTDDTLRDHT